MHEGGAIVAGGDIVVVGRLRGSVHGGRNGDRGAVVYATQLDACHIRIADATFVTESHFSDRPAIASIQEDGKLEWVVPWTLTSAFFKWDFSGLSLT